MKIRENIGFVIKLIIINLLVILISLWTYDTYLNNSLLDDANDYVNNLEESTMELVDEAQENITNYLDENNLSIPEFELPSL